VISVPERTVLITPQNLAILEVAGRPLYLIRTPAASLWDYGKEILVQGQPGLRFKRHLVMFETKGHYEALELEVVAGKPPNRSELVGKVLAQETSPNSP